MSDDRFGNSIGFHLFHGIAIDSRATLFLNHRNAEFTVEQSLEVLIGPPVEMGHTHPFENNPLEVSLEHFQLVMEIIDDIGLAGLIDADAPEPHFEGRGLEGLGESVGLPSGFVELGELGLKALGGDAAIQSVINLIPFPLRGDVGREAGIGEDYAGHLFVSSNCRDQFALGLPRAMVGVDRPEVGQALQAFGLKGMLGEHGVVLGTSDADSISSPKEGDIVKSVLEELGD